MYIRFWDALELGNCHQKLHWLHLSKKATAEHTHVADRQC